MLLRRHFVLSILVQTPFTLRRWLVAGFPGIFEVRKTNFKRFQSGLFSNRNWQRGDLDFRTAEIETVDRLRWMAVMRSYGLRV